MWKNDKKSLDNMGQAARNHIKSLGLDYESVGDKLYNSIVSTEKIEKVEPPAKVYTKQGLETLKTQVSNQKNIEDKLSVLHNSFEGDTCYILNCGPSLKNYSPEYLKEKLSDKLVFAVKQSYDYCPDIVDFHFFNCSNLPMPENGIHYNYPENKVISIGSSNYPLGARWSKAQPVDVFLKVPIRTKIDGFLCDDRNYDDYLLENSPNRPCGPGIMYETVMHMAVHLGVSKIVVLGWDLGGNPKDPSEYKHFYDNRKKLFNPGDILKDEIERTRVGIKSMNKWLSEKQIELIIASNISRISLTIPRGRV